MCAHRVGGAPVGLPVRSDASVHLCRLIKPGDRVLDVGTNVGYYTLMFAQLVGPQGRVLGIEASPRTFDLVSTTVEFNGLSSHVSSHPAGTCTR